MTEKTAIEQAKALIKMLNIPENLVSHAHSQLLCITIGGGDLLKADTWMNAESEDIDSLGSEPRTRMLYCVEAGALLPKVLHEHVGLIKAYQKLVVLEDSLRPRWQPIETAPRDGTVIDLLDLIGNEIWYPIYNCVWNGEGWKSDEGIYKDCNGYDFRYWRQSMELPPLPEEI